MLSFTEKSTRLPPMRTLLQLNKTPKRDSFENSRRVIFISTTDGKVTKFLAVYHFRHSFLTIVAWLSQLASDVGGSDICSPRRWRMQRWQWPGRCCRNWSPNCSRRSKFVILFFNSSGLFYALTLFAWFSSSRAYDLWRFLVFWWWLTKVKLTGRW